jgi:hypothetical protein
MPIESLCTRWNHSPPATRCFASAMAGVSGSSSTWIVPISAASGGAKYFGESCIARSPWYVFFAMTFLRLLLPSGGFDLVGAAIPIVRIERMRSRTLCVAMFSSTSGVYSMIYAAAFAQHMPKFLHVRTILAVTAITPQRIFPRRQLCVAGLLV